MRRPTLHYWIATLYLPKIGPRTFLRCLQHFSSIEDFFHASDTLLHSLNLTLEQRQGIQAPNWAAIEKDLLWADQSNHHLIPLEDAAYPKLLKEITDPPLLLYIQGNPTALHHPQLAIVGSRHATPIGLHNARHFAECLATAGLTITSGLALGIDGASHQGALQANGITIGVAGTGLQSLYPPSNRKLAAEIIENNGAVISEFPLAMQPHAANFPRRNRIISGLSLGVLVIEAALKSGSLITVRHALEQGREVFAIPGSIHHPLARGCNHLIRQGAKLVEKADDILEELGALAALFNLAPPTPPKPRRKTANSPEPQAQTLAVYPLSPKEKHVLALIDYEITPIDVILLRAGLTNSELSSILLILELHGYIQSVTGGYSRVVPNQ